MERLHGSPISKAVDHGITAPVIQATIIAKDGPKMNKNLLESFGVISSLRIILNHRQAVVINQKSLHGLVRYDLVRMLQLYAQLQVEYMATTNAKPIITPTKANFSNASAINSSVILLILFTND